MSSGKTAEDPVWKSREQAAEAQYARAKEQEQLQAIRDSLAANSNEEPAKLKASEGSAAHGQPADAADFEGGYGGQEELEDRYATTYGMH